MVLTTVDTKYNQHLDGNALTSELNTFLNTSLGLSYVVISLRENIYTEYLQES